MNRVPAVAAVAVAIAGGPVHAARIEVEMKPAVTRSAVVITYKGAAADTLVPNYVASFTVTGSITSNGVTTAVTDRWDGLLLAPYGLTGQRSYPAPANSKVALTFSVRVVAPSGVPTASCVGVLTREPGRAPAVTGGC